jgi:DNA mismatch repair ATPase MutS
MLSNPSREKNIGHNQEAVNELKGKNEWRQSVQARGRMIPEAGNELAELKHWLASSVSITLGPFMLVLLYALPVITIILIILATFLIPFNIPIFLFLIQLGIIAGYLAKINKEFANISKKNLLLNKYRILLENTENEQFTSKVLTGLQKKLLNPVPVSSEIKKLARLTGQFDWRLNMLMGIVMNAIFLWDLQCIRRLNNWKNEHGSQVSDWFDILAEFDALSSLAGFAFNNPDYTFPVVNSDEKLISSRELGHPLIPAGERVANDLDINRWGKLILVTGSNMSGKSTYLRTIGVNLILAMTGAPVCAKSLGFQPVEIYTSMRVGDSLRNRESTFYAELRRLKSIIDHYTRGNKALILLDEILKGTNSKDKHFGSQMLIRQLIEYNAAGIIATHDLELSIIEDEFPENLLNYSFEVQIKDGQFNFDFKLKRGVCQTLNATELMKQMGISVSRDR